MNLLQKRRKERQKKERANARSVRWNAMTPAQQAVREQRRQSAQAVRAEKAEHRAIEKRRLRTERDATRLQCANSAAAAEAQRHERSVKVLQQEAAAEAGCAHPERVDRKASKPLRPQPAQPAQPAPNPAAIALSNVRPRAVPERSTLEVAASTEVFSADASGGIRGWDEGAGAWARPEGWMLLVQKLFALYSTHDDGGVDVVTGEYNAVFLPDQTHPLLPLCLYELMGAQPDGVVVRITRPDAEEPAAGTVHTRFKSLVAMVRELYHTLHAAANDVAPQCLAAVVFPATVCGGVQMYGALYVARRAVQDAKGLLDNHVATLRRLSAPQFEQQVRDAGAQVGRAVADLLHRLSALGVVNTDVKLGNIVFNEDYRAMAIDFDGAMYSIMHEGDGWAAHLLANLALVTAHVRAFCIPPLAEGWVAEVRGLLLEVLRSARELGAGAAWVFSARARPRKFVDLHGDKPSDAIARIEFIINSYFTQADHTRVRFVPCTGCKAAPLIVQLVSFCLLGHTRGDEAIWSAMGQERRVASWPKPPMPPIPSPTP